MSQAQTTVAAAVAAAVAILTAEQIDACTTSGIALAQADESFESAIKNVATSVAQILGTKPSFDQWAAVANAFQDAYVGQRECKPETAAKRWYAVAQAMESEFALEKPAKPTKSAEVKAEQRKGAAAEAAELIAKAGAKTPAAVLALSQAGVKGPVIAALAKEAGKMAETGAKAANDAAKERAKALREEIRKALGELNVSQLETIRAAIAGFKPVETEKTTEEEATV